MDGIADCIGRIRLLCDEALKATPAYATQAATPYSRLRQTVKGIVAALDDLQDVYANNADVAEGLAGEPTSLPVLPVDDVRSAPQDAAEPPARLAAGRGDGLGGECGAPVSPASRRIAHSDQHITKPSSGDNAPRSVAGKA